MSSSSPSGSDLPRIVAGRYQIVRKIGSGGMGAVYLARQVGVGNHVALKFLPADLADDPELRRRFEREAALTLQVTHPGAAQLLDTGRDGDGQLFLAFEFVEGDDLSTWLRRDGALAYDEAFAVTLKVAEALAYAHQKGVVHRDIKPENIRVRRDLAGLHVKVLDFGIARLSDDAATRLTVEGGVAGTPRYMAPEQITGGTVDARTDVYALGLVLFEMLTGRKAVDRASPSQIMWAQVNEPVPPLRSVQPLRDHQALDAIIARACAKQPSERFDSMHGMIRALQEIPPPRWPTAQAGEGRGDPPVGSGDQAFAATVVLSQAERPTPARRKTVGAGLAVAAIAAVAVAVALGFAIGSGKDATPVAVGPPTTAAASTVGSADPVPASPPSVAASTAFTPPTTFTPPTASTATTATAAPTAPTATAARAATSDPLVSKAATAGVKPAATPVVVQDDPVRPVVPAVTPPVAIVAAATPPADAGDCTPLSHFDPAVARLSVAQLEQRARDARHLAPSVALRQLETLRASAGSYAPEMRGCLYKASLVQTVLSERTLLQSTPSLWGHTKEVAELERLFLEQPLREDWSAAQRRSVLDQIEKLFIANLAKEAPGDDVYWRRMYYGLVFACEASDAALAAARTRRPADGNCPRLRPAG